jgi:hypothetical protein
MRLCAAGASQGSQHDPNRRRVERTNAPEVETDGICARECGQFVRERSGRKIVVTVPL